jgi:hypothetical protein
MGAVLNASVLADGLRADRRGQDGVADEPSRLAARPPEPCRGGAKELTRWRKWLVLLAISKVTVEVASRVAEARQPELPVNTLNLVLLVGRFDETDFSHAKPAASVEP